MRVSFYVRGADEPVAEFGPGTNNRPIAQLPHKGEALALCGDEYVVVDRYAVIYPTKDVDFWKVTVEERPHADQS